ncbi:GNAT family N-acetyltransferase [Acidipropionibacterium jensenii]|uniref:GNAT family N-acetyltransferase n=1 Tax=Acidipropionibacterium jensenii TaxID=1749 RepID=UPI000BC320CF|nr:GNAT family N-acetyltransferase [Acidipropionibacterium jensenii]
MVRIDILEAHQKQVLRQVIELGDRNRRTLGLLPRGAYEEYAKSGKIIVALEGSKLVGYAVADLPLNRIRLVQLCVAESVRHTGIAKRIVDRIVELNPAREGIQLRCRRDWPANEYWGSLGFVARSNQPGRSKTGEQLTTWWLDFGKKNLFTTDGNSNRRLVVAIDTNVFRDIVQCERGEGANESRALEEEWLDDQVELRLVASVVNEINDIPDRDVRESLLGIANSEKYNILKVSGSPDRGRLESLLKTLIGRIPREAMEHDESLRNDARIFAEADVSQADALVTRDCGALRALSVAADGLSTMWLSTPTDLIVHLDEVRDNANYSPVHLRNSGYTTSELAAKNEDDLRPLLNSAEGERLADFRKKTRRVAARVGVGGKRRVIRNSEGEIVAAALAIEEPGGVLQVGLLRAAHSRLDKTLAIQLVHLLRAWAIEANSSTITVKDERIGGAVRSALLEMGYESIPDGYTAQVLTGQRTWREFLQSVYLENDDAEHDIEKVSIQTVGAVEKSQWPLKITDSLLPCYLVPIRPNLADALFGIRNALFNDDELLLSWEQVYYRSSRGCRITAPGRILWYSSNPAKEALGVSHLEEVVIGSAKTLHRRFKRISALDLRAVESKCGNDGKVMALKFCDTEFFNTPVSLMRLRQIDSGLVPLQSPRRVDSASFFSVYGEGMA